MTPRRQRLVSAVVAGALAAGSAAGVIGARDVGLVSSTAQAAAPTSSPRAMTSARSAKLYGVWAVPNLTGAEYQRMGTLGVSMARLQLNWRWIEAGRGARDWSYFDQQLADAARAGIRVLPVLFGVPKFISTDASMPPVRTKRERRQWRGFVADAARRYGPGGSFWALHPELPALPITAWQPGNEPNLPFYFGGKVSVRRFRDLLKITSVGLHSVDPDAAIVTGGIFRYRTVPGSVSLIEYLKRLYALRGIKRWFDVLGVHPYSPRPRGMARVLARARKVMRRFRDGRTPIWVTEFGWTTGGKGWRTNAFRATKSQQARRLKTSYRLFKRRRGLRVRRAFWHSFKDFTMPGPDYWTGRMGLLTLDGRRKPSWYAYARVAGGRP